MEYTKERYLALDILRGIAALGVVLTHFSGTFFSIWPSYANLTPDVVKINVGQEAVKLFFVISGFVIPLSMDKNLGWNDFIVMRLSRIFPAYWVCVMITYAVTLVIPVTGRGKTLWTALANLSMLQTFVGIDPLDVVYWTLLLEMFFYLWAVVSFGFSRSETLEWILAGLVVLDIVELRTHFFTTIPHLAYRLSNLFMFYFSPYFLAGITIYASRHKMLLRHLLFLALFVVALLLQSNSALNISIGVLIPASVYVVTRFKFSWENSHGLQWLGRISYPLYLVHCNVGYTIMLLLLRRGCGIYVCIVAASVGGITLATLVSNCVEYPAMRWIRHKWLAFSKRDVLIG